MDAPILELKSALASLFGNPKYSDLTIACRGKRYPVHRALLATRSTFFEGACRNSFLEAQTGVVDLSEDDPEAVEHMVHYFYHLDYLRNPLNRRLSQCSSQTPSTSRRSSMRTSGPQRISLSFFEDPLLATANATDKSLPLTPPLEEPTSGVIDTSTKFFDMKEANHSSHHEFGLKQSEPDLDLDKVHLVTHAKVYAIAEKYGIFGLKALACNKFAQELSIHLDSSEFPEACQEAYETTFHTDRGLRDIIIQAFRANPGLSLRQDMELVIRETPSLAFELFKMASGLPVAS